MSFTVTSKNGFSRNIQNSISSAATDLSVFRSWKKMHIIDVPMANSESAFNWLVENYGHNEFNSSYGPTFDSKWFGPFTTHAKPNHHAYIMNDIAAATLFRLFHG